MGPKVPDVLVTVGLGLLLGGPLASVAWVALPPDWRGPAVPWTAGAAALALVALCRHPRRGAGGPRGPRPAPPAP